MNGELFLVCGFAGYWFLRLWNLTRLDTVRAESYHILFKSILAGGVLLIAARWISSFLDGNVLSFIGEVLYPFPPKGNNHVDVVILIIALGFVLPLLMNRLAELLSLFDITGKCEIRRRLLCTQLEGALRNAEKTGQDTDLVLMKSCHQRKVIEVLLQDHVAYIAFVSDYSLESSIHTTDVKILPLVKYYQPPEAVPSGPNIDEALVNKIRGHLEQGRFAELENLKVVIQRASIVHVRMLSEVSAVEAVERFESL